MWKKNQVSWTKERGIWYHSKEFEKIFSQTQWGGKKFNWSKKFGESKERKEKSWKNFEGREEKIIRLLVANKTWGKFHYLAPNITLKTHKLGSGIELMIE